MTLYEQIEAKVSNPANRKRYITRGRAAVGGGSACAATQSFLFLELGIIHNIYVSTEKFTDSRGIKHPGLVDTLKSTRLFDASHLRSKVKKFTLVVCDDLNKDKDHRSDHVWMAMDDGDGKGNYLCFDNQSMRLSKRRLDGLDGKTPMRGCLNLK